MANSIWEGLCPFLSFSFLFFVCLFSAFVLRDKVSGFLCVALEPVLELSVDQAGLRFTEVGLPLLPEFCN